MKKGNAEKVYVLLGTSMEFQKQKKKSFAIAYKKSSESNPFQHNFPLPRYKKKMFVFHSVQKFLLFSPCSPVLNNGAK